LRSYQTKFHRDGMPDLSGKAVILVDDGLATGRLPKLPSWLFEANARRITVAAPVASTNAVERLQRVADEVFCAVGRPESFDAVGALLQYFHTNDGRRGNRIAQEQFAYRRNA